MAALIDICRPGVGLLDQEDYNWEYSGERVGTQWSDKWKREDGITRKLDEIIELCGPVTVILQSYDGSQAWWKKDSNFQ